MPRASGARPSSRPKHPERGASAPRWTGVEAPAILPADAKKLVEGRIPYIRIPGFLRPDWCREVSRRIMESDPPVLQSVEAGNLYSEKVTPGTMFQVGFALYQAMIGSRVEEFFQRAGEISKTIRKLYSGGDDPFLKFQAMLSETTGWNILSSEDNGGHYVSDLIWVMPSGTKLMIHSDSPENLKPLRVSAFPHQLSCNIYLSMPESGGELVLYRKNPRSCAEPGNAEEIRASETVVTRPDVGDLILFHAGNYHEVLPPKGPSPRISNHTSIAFSPKDSSAIFWAG